MKGFVRRRDQEPSYIESYLRVHPGSQRTDIVVEVFERVVYEGPFRWRRKVACRDDGRRAIA